MSSPTFDCDGYPTEDTLLTLVNWDAQDWSGMMDYLHSAWQHGYGRMKLDSGVLELATGGWSGNEDIIGALMDNLMFHALYWQSSHRGGKHIFSRK